MNSKSSHQKINILHLRDSPWVDGPGRTIIESASAIDSSRFNYMIGAFCSTISSDNDFIKEAKKRKLRLFIIKENRSFDFGVINQIRNIIKQNDVHILHTHDIRTNFFGLICARIEKKLLITTLHGWIGNTKKQNIFVFFDKILLQFFDHIIAVSQLMADHIQKFKVPNKRISVLYNSLIIDNYKPDKQDKTFRRELSIQDDTILVGNIGRLNLEKGQKEFISAASRVVKRYQNIKFVCVGKGPDKKYLYDFSKKLGIESFIVFTGYRNDMINIYNSLDLVVQSSYTEGMPNVILEAMLMKVPVIATAVGGTPEIINHNETGILIEPHSIDEISNNILEFIFHRDRFDNYRNIGAHIIKSKFNFLLRTYRLQEIYYQILCSHK